MKRHELCVALGWWEPLLDIEQEEDGSWSVSIKAMPGHVGASRSTSLRDAIVEAADAAEAWVEAARDPT